MEFAEFAARAETIEAASADTEIISRVAELCTDAGDALSAVVRFVQGRVFPAWSSQTLDIGPSLCYQAIARAAGPNINENDVERCVAETGDIGAAAAAFDLGGQRGLAAFAGGEDTLRVQEIADELTTLAEMSGAGSQDRKLDALFGLFNRCTDTEAKYLARLVLEELRIGVGGGTVRDAISEAFEVSTAAVERALQVSNDYGLVAETAREQGTGGLEAIKLEVGRPVQAMLAQAGTVTEALEEWDAVAVETKYDGARVQVHYDESGVRLFSRNMEEVTEPLPEIVETIDEHCEYPAILDGEVVAVDEAGNPLPFQEILRRFRRKYDIEQARADVETRLHVFDCLHAPESVHQRLQKRDVAFTDGEVRSSGGIDLLDAPLRVRRQYLNETISSGTVSVTVTDDSDQIETIETEALEAGHEGIMLKNPAAAYTPGRRGKDWLKRKPDVETLDLVVIGAEWGEGRRANLFGTFELAARDEDGYKRVGNVATGVTDEQLETLTDQLTDHVQTETGQHVTFEPAVVFEVGYEEIQRSPSYEAGYALRFPRFIERRTDKDPAGADTVDRIEGLAESN